MIGEKQLSNLQKKSVSTADKKKYKKIAKKIGTELFAYRMQAKWEWHREDRDRKMNFDYWEYDSVNGSYYLHFVMLAEECWVRTTITVKMETLIKWYEKYEGSSINVIKELRSIFSLSQISTKEGYQALALPLKPAKEIWDDFAQHYQGLLGIRTGS